MLGRHAIHRLAAANRRRDGHAQANLGFIRRAALSVLKNTAALSGGVHSRRKQAGWDDEAREAIILGQTIRPS